MSQATSIEQARVVAEVEARVIVAQRLPRDEHQALASMRQSCSMLALADSAFFSYPRGGKDVTGPTIKLARELARIWGNVDAGISELRRDDEGGYSELMAWAWDYQTNYRVSHTFVVPHRRDRNRDGRYDPVQLVELRDIYENNSNMGNRRLRECIFGVLPSWFADEAKSLCADTVKNTEGGEKTLPQRRADAVKLFETEWNVTVRQLSDALGRGVNEWTVFDLSKLRDIRRQLVDGSITVEEAFAPPPVTADEVRKRSEVSSSETGNGSPDDAGDAEWTAQARGEQ